MSIPSQPEISEATLRLFIYLVKTTEYEIVAKAFLSVQQAKNTVI